MVERVFYPVSRREFEERLQSGQRYRHPFGDFRLTHRFQDIVSRLCKKRSGVIHQLSDERKDSVGAYRFVCNDKVALPELIYQSSRVAVDQIKGKDLQVNLDRTSISLALDGNARRGWAEQLGVLEDNSTAGFYLCPSLILERSSQHCLGIGDILFHTRPKTSRNKEANVRRRAKRRYFPLEQKESGIWAIVASNTAEQLQAARKVTFVIDQAADCYAVFKHMINEVQRDFIIRVNYDRRATSCDTGQTGKFSQLLASRAWSDVRSVPLRALIYRERLSDVKQVKRKKRVAQLAIRYFPLHLATPPPQRGRSTIENQALTLVEVKELAHTVPKGEPPVHWCLLSSWKVDQADTAWQVVQAYQGRWHIEQLFRCCKKKGFDIEHSKLRDPKRIIKLAVMSVKASAEALRLTQVRDGEEFVDIETMFDEQKQKILQTINAKLCGSTVKLSNPHPANSLAWAAWVIARLGGWKGYTSQGKPGPITMTKGLARFYDLAYWMNQNQDDP